MGDSTKRRRFALKSLRRKDTVGIMLLGDEKIGKTGLVKRWLHGKFQEVYKPTVEDFSNKTFMSMGRNVNVGLIDIAGSSQFPAMDQLYIKKSDVIIFVYEIGNEKSIESIKHYCKVVKECVGDKDISIVVTGTKLDKFDETGFYGDYEIPKEYFNMFETQPHQYLTSSKTGHNVQELFEHAVGLVATHLLPDVERLKPSRKEHPGSPEEGGKSCCVLS